MVSKNKPPLVLFAIVALSMTIAGCRQHLVELDKISNPSSPLLSALLQRTDFSDKVQVIDKFTVQPGSPQPIANQTRSDSAGTFIKGFYQTGSYFVDVNQEIETYNDPVAWDNVRAIEFHDAEPISTTITPLGNHTSTKCVKPPYLFACQIVASYGHTILLMTIYVPRELGEATFNEVVNDVLTAADDRIKKIDK